MNEQARALLSKRKDRSIAIMLGFKERECDEFLPLKLRSELRKVILDQVNDLYDVALDVVNSLDNGTVVLNIDYLDKIDRIHEKLVGE